MRTDQVAGAVVAGTVSRALDLGSSADLRSSLDAVCLGSGRVTGVELEDSGGFLTGSVVVASEAGEAGDLRVDVRNEYVGVWRGEHLLASAPDSINLLARPDALPVATESLATLAAGTVVDVLAWRCDPCWRTPRGLAVAGPRAFGYDRDVPPELIPRRGAALSRPR